MSQYSARPRLDEATLRTLIALRRALHREPELSGHERTTAARMRAFLEAYAPDELVTGLGGYGLAARFGAADTGPTLVLRADLDALPIHEEGRVPHRSIRDGVAHLCGHDGHMAIVAGLAPGLAAERPRSGRVWLLLQPAEETGQGAARVVDDPAFARIDPDLVIGLHNLPGEPLGRPVLRSGTFAAGSAGAIINLEGSTSHAAHPEQGRSPARAVAALIGRLESLGETVQEDLRDPASFAFATVVHVRLGEVAFGTTPGQASVMATIRSDSEQAMGCLQWGVITAAREEAERAGLEHRLWWTEVFPITTNHPQVVELITRAALSCGLEPVERPEPFRWSEDFGVYTRRWPGALVGIGAGHACEPLHAPCYDFPDELIEPGTRLLHAVIAEALAST
jgi:amidohydrolase